MEKKRCDLCREEKSIEEFRITSNENKDQIKICRACEVHRDSELWL